MVSSESHTVIPLVFMFRFGSKAETIENREMAILSSLNTKTQYLRNVAELCFKCNGLNEEGFRGNQKKRCLTAHI